MAITELGIVGTAENKVSGTTLAITANQIIPAGTFLALALTLDNHASTTMATVSLSSSGGGTWTSRAGAIGSGATTTAGTGIFGVLQTCKTTTQISSGATITTVTFGNAVVGKAAVIVGYFGVENTSRNTSGFGAGNSASGAPSATTNSTGSAPVAGDLVIGTIHGETNAAPGADTDTTNGSWGTVRSFATTGGGGATTHCVVGIQHKVITANGNQTYNATTANDSVAYSMAFLPSPDPSITQAAYRFYQDGTESGSTAAAAQDTALTLNLYESAPVLTLRVRLQSTTAVDVPGVDDFRLQYEIDASGTWIDVTAVSLDVAGDVANPNFTEGQATTNRLTGGSGTFVAGKVSEDGLVDNVGWSANNYTELAYAILMSSTFGITVRFRVLHNGATTTMTYSVTPTINVVYTTPTITQAAYRFYADDTGTPALADSYPSSNWNAGGTIGLFSTQTAAAQSFMGDGKKLAQAGFYLRRNGSPDGAVTAALFAHSGSFGAGGIPTGTALATSTTTVSTSSLATTLTWTYFDFDGSFTLAAGTAYCIAVTSTVSTAVPNTAEAGGDSTSPTHGGSLLLRSSGGTWTASTGIDMMFEVYTTPGGESSSTVLAAQDTAYTVDVSGGDVNLLLRTRLQSTNSVTVKSTDDWGLQWEKNASGTWTDVVSPVESIGASYDIIAGAGEAGLITNVTAYGQAFTGNGQKLSKVEFRLSKNGTPSAQTLTGRVLLQNGGGTFGTDGKPGTLLGSSTNSIAATALPTTPDWRTFNFDGSVLLAAGTKYCVAAQSADGTANDTSNHALFSQNTAAPTHEGNRVYYISAWSGGGIQDVLFRVYTLTSPSTVLPFDSVNLTDGEPTTNRLTGGTGTFTAGKVSEDGEVDDLGWSGNNHTELLYAITLKSTDVTEGDTIRFRVVHATIAPTYSQTPTINVGTGEEEPAAFSGWGIPI